MPQPTIRYVPPKTLHHTAPPAAVQELKRRLRGLGLRVTSGAAFDKETDLAVRSFQGAHGLTADGVVGPKTWSALEHALEAKSTAHGEGTASTGAAHDVAGKDHAPASSVARCDAVDRSARDQAVAKHREAFTAFADDLAKRAGQAKLDRARALLELLERVSASFASGALPSADALACAPRPVDQAPMGTYAPPELIPVARRIIAVVERPIEGLTTAEGAQVEGSLYVAGEDWNARLGVPQYRTQSDNLSAPEATCNVTSMSMVLERLGYSREHVVAAVERELAARGKTDAGAWDTAVRAHLANVNRAEEPYQRVRGRDTSPAERAAMAARFRSVAQMEDVLDLLVGLLKVSREAIAASPGSVLRAIEPRPELRPTVSIIEGGSVPWATAKARAHEAVEAGGGVILSVFHKGRKADGKLDTAGKHLVTIAHVTEGGAVLDDPYGRIRSDYDRHATGDAYAAPGKKRSESTYKNEVESARNDWTVGAAQSASSTETRGVAYELPDEVIAGMWNRLTVFRRPARRT